MLRHVATFCLALIPFIGSAQEQDSDVSLPSIRFETQKIDIGDTLFRRNTEYLYLFIYENDGTAPLIVNKVVASCPCIREEHTTDPLPPGQRDTLRVFFTPSHASKFTQRLTVFTNSPSTGIQLFARGNFLKPSEWKTRKQQKTDSQ